MASLPFSKGLPLPCRETANAINQKPEAGKAVFPVSISRSILIKRTSITLDDRVYETGLDIAAQRGFSQSFSAYIAWLIQRDAAGGVTREEAPKASKPTKARPAAAKSAAKATPKPKAKAAPAKKKPKPAAASATRKRAKSSR